MIVLIAELSFGALRAVGRAQRRIVFCQAEPPALAGIIPGASALETPERQNGRVAVSLRHSANLALEGLATQPPFERFGQAGL